MLFFRHYQQNIEKVMPKSTLKKTKIKRVKKEKSAGLFSVITKGEPCRAVDISQKTGERNRIFIDSGCNASLDTSEP